MFLECQIIILISEGSYDTKDWSKESTVWYFKKYHGFTMKFRIFSYYNITCVGHASSDHYRNSQMKTTEVTQIHQ